MKYYLDIYVALENFDFISINEVPVSPTFQRKT